MLKDRTHFPPGGFKFHEARTGWSSTDHIGFSDTVLEIIRHREANKGRFDWATDYEAVSTELDAYVEANLRSLYGKGADPYLLGGVASAGPPLNPLWRSLRARAGGASAAVGATSTTKKVQLGVGLLMDFLGPSLKAVPHALAEKRASICVACPKNQKGGLVAHLGGEGLKLMLQARSDLKLETSHDAKLFDCAVCDCNLHIKTHVDLAFILERTTPEQMAAFPDFCWIKNHDK